MIHNMRNVPHLAALTTPSHKEEEEDYSSLEKANISGAGDLNINK